MGWCRVSTIAGDWWLFDLGAFNFTRRQLRLRFKLFNLWIDESHALTALVSRTKTNATCYMHMRVLSIALAMSRML